MTTPSLHSRDASAVSPALAQKLKALQGRGRSLPLRDRAFFEEQWDSSFDDVRIHVGGPADATCRAIRARAFTFGRDIAFSRGSWSPDSPQGKRLLAHELVHVMQQRGGQRQVLQRAPDHGSVDTPDVDALIDDIERLTRLIESDEGVEGASTTRGDLIELLAHFDSPVGGPLSARQLAALDRARLLVLGETLARSFAPGSADTRRYRYQQHVADTARRDPNGFLTTYALRTWNRFLTDEEFIHYWDTDVEFRRFFNRYVYTFERPKGPHIQMEAIGPLGGARTQEEYDAKAFAADLEAGPPLQGPGVVVGAPVYAAQRLFGVEHEVAVGRADVVASGAELVLGAARGARRASRKRPPRRGRKPSSRRRARSRVKRSAAAAQRRRSAKAAKQLPRKPTSDSRQEPLVAVRIQGGGSGRKGTYFVEGTREFEWAARRGDFMVIPKSWAEPWFRRAGTPHSTTIKPLRIRGKIVESEGAGRGLKHNIVGRAPTQKTPARAKEVFDKTIGAARREDHGHKHLVQMGELVILRPGNVNAPGVDSITVSVSVSSGQAQIFLNDFTGKSTWKGKKGTHRRWLKELTREKKAGHIRFPDHQKAIDEAIDYGPVFIRIIRVDVSAAGVSVKIVKTIPIRMRRRP